MTEPRVYTVVLSAAAKRAIERDLPEAVAVAVVDFLYGPLAAEPHRVGKPLRLELDGYWSARRGQYRVIYSIRDDEVLVRVVRISHRVDVYRQSSSRATGSATTQSCAYVATRPSDTASRRLPAGQEPAFSTSRLRRSLAMPRPRVSPSSDGERDGGVGVAQALRDHPGATPGPTRDAATSRANGCGQGRGQRRVVAGQRPVTDRRARSDGVQAWNGAATRWTVPAGCATVAIPHAVTPVHATALGESLPFRRCPGLRSGWSFPTSASVPRTSLSSSRAWPPTPPSTGCWSQKRP